MSLARVARPYAQALFDSARDQNQLEAVAENMHALLTLSSASKELRRFLENPILTREVKRQTIVKLFENQLNPLVLKFLLFLVDKRRLNLLGLICKTFDQLYAESRNLTHVEITSAFAVDQAQVEAICEKLRQKFHKEIRYNVSVDPGLLGGFKVKTDDEVYDFSFASQLEKFRQSIRNI